MADRVNCGINGGGDAIIWALADGAFLACGDLRGVGRRRLGGA